MKVLEDCESDLLTSWGFDKAAQAAVAERPKGNLQGLLRPDDYPQAAIDSNASGRVDVRLRIEADGRISDCSILESSGNTALDKQTCALIVKRARYAPALGHDGKPIWTFTFATVTWMLS